MRNQVLCLILLAGCGATTGVGDPPSGGGERSPSLSGVDFDGGAVLFELSDGGWESLVPGVDCSDWTNPGALGCCPGFTLGVLGESTTPSCNQCELLVNCAIVADSCAATHLGSSAGIPVCEDPTLECCR